MPVEGELHGLRRIVGPAAELSVGRSGTRDQSQHAFPGSVRLGDVYENLIRQFRVHVRAIRLEHGGFGSNFDLIRLRTYLKPRVDANHVVLIYQDV